MRIAIIGAGISGLYAAWRLSPRHQVTVYEAADYWGGHTNTVDVEWEGVPYAVDTGFIVFNDWTYPNFIAMLKSLGVAWQPSNMSFSLQCERTGLEYNGTSANTLFAQRKNLVRPKFLGMIFDILRFNSRSQALLAGDDDSLTLAKYLQRERYSKAFTEQYILPMGRSIWSAEADAILEFPVRFFVDFFKRHGFLNVDNRPQWQTVSGGSREYVRKLIEQTRARWRISTPVIGVQRQPHHVSVRTTRGEVEHYDTVFFACHSDQVLRMLSDPTGPEREVLGAFPYAANRAYLHTDERLLPRLPLARAAWNYHLPAERQQPVAITYDMNVLQTLYAPVRFLVTLNHARAIDEHKILHEVQYHHPVYLPSGVQAQRRHREVNGVCRTYYTGAYWRYGFHEDGVVSAMQALEHFAADHPEAAQVEKAGPANTDAKLSLQRVG